MRTLLLLLALLTGPAFAKTLYEVHLISQLELPRDSSVRAVRIWHALPPGPFLSLRSLPLQGVEGQYRGERFVVWEESELTGPVTLESSFVVPSEARPFSPEECDWDDLDDPGEVPAPAEVREEAARVRDAFSPREAVGEILRWSRARLAYVATAPYPPQDLTTTLSHGQGHCGHYAELFCRVCRCAGIPARVVRGLSLYDPLGEGLPFCNIHAWAEVQFPDGWHEVDPHQGQAGVPPRLIRNNGWFQNFAMWVRDQDGWRPHRWLYEKGTVRSEIGWKQKVTYSVLRPWFDPRGKL